MKTNRTLTICGVGLLTFNLTLLPTYANNDVDSRAISAALSKATAPEMGPKAAELVKLAPAKQAEATAKQVVLATVKISPAATVSVVGAISKQNSEVAPMAAGTAAGKMPKLAVAIARAAVTAAPSQAGKIVQAICKEVPKDYKAVALAVAQIVPSAGKEILDGVAAAIPSLKTFIATVQSAYSQSAIVPVASILQQVEVAQTGSGTASGFEPLISPPVQGPPFMPLGGTPTEINPGNNSNLPPGGRDYSAP